MDLMKHAATSQKGISNEALDTFKGIAQSIHEHSMKSPWERANEHMKKSLKEVKAQAKNKTEFLKLAKQETGIAKNSHPLLIWCVKEWY